MPVEVTTTAENSLWICKCDEDRKYREMYSMCSASATLATGTPNVCQSVRLSHPSLSSCSLSPFAYTSLSREVIGVRVYEGLASPTGQPVLCMSLIKHSFLIGAPPPSHPSFFLSSLSRPCDAQWAH